MPVTERDLALLAEELKCLREKMSTLISTAGGYTDVLTSPGSSVYPDEYRENCSCVDVDVYEGNPQAMCQTTDGTEGTTGVGDIAEDVYQPGSIRGLFMFDAINGVFYKPPDSNTWENRNTGLSSNILEHGCLDVWWYRKNTPSDDNAILWRCGVGTVQTTLNAGRIDWKNRSPEPPTGYTLGQITFIQIVSDPFTQNTFYLLATANGYKTWIVKTTDNGQSWTWLDLTSYNSVSSRFPVWMALKGNGAGIIWVTTWGDGQLRALKLNNGSPITISAEYNLGTASEWEVRNYYQSLSPSAGPDANTVYFFGRASNPQSLGLSHIIKTANDGLNWSVHENTWGLDWCGSVKVGISDDVYAVRNVRGIPTTQWEDGPQLIGSVGVQSGKSSGSNVYTGFGAGYFFDNYDTVSIPTRLMRGSVALDGSNLPVITGRAQLNNNGVFAPLGFSFYNDGLDAFIAEDYGVGIVQPPSGSISNSGVFGWWADFLDTDNWLVWNNTDGLTSTAIRWRALSGGTTIIDSIVFDNTTIGIAIQRVNSTDAVCVYQNNAGNLAAKLVRIDTGTPDLIDVATTTGGPAVGNSLGYMVRVATNSYALIYYDGTNWRIVEVTTTTSTVSFGTSSVITSVSNIVKIDSSRVGYAARSGSNLIAGTISLGGTQTEVTVYTYAGTVYDASFGVGYVGGHLIVSYVDDNEELRLASVSI